MKYITQIEFAKNHHTTRQAVIYLIEKNKLNTEKVYGRKLIVIDNKYKEFIANYKPKTINKEVIK
jgi:hypothetical protein